jgi:tetratricopeptide (TPR) repeat protein
VNRPRKPIVSLCMIVRNEGHQLADCLSPVAELFDEIVVVDTGSRDDTREVARRFTTRVFDFPWCDDFSAARNESLRHAQGEWIFWLDADDRISAENIARLRELLSRLDQGPDAYMMETAVRMDRDSRDNERLVSHMRLFRRHPALSWRGRVHEQIRPWPTAIGLEVGFSPVRIEHVGYLETGLAQRKLRRNIRLLRMDYAVNPDDPQILVDLGFATAQSGNSAEARRLLRRVLEQPAQSSFLLLRVLTTLGELETHAGNFSEVVSLMARGLSLFPGNDYLAYMQAEAYYNLGRYDLAKRLLAGIIHEPPQPRGLSVGTPSDIKSRLAPLGLGEVLRSERAFASAETIFREVAEAFPNDASAWYFLGRVYVDMANRWGLNEVVSRLAGCERGSFYASLLIGAWQLSQKDWKGAEATIDDLIGEAPQMLLPRVMRASCLNRRGAPAADQLQAYRDVLRVQPGNVHAASMIERLSQIRAAPAAANSIGLGTSVILGAGVPNGVVSG